MAIFVLVHGGWDGGWAWQAVARELRAAGHEVFTPTFTGSGERAHLATPQVGLSTHIQDIVNVLHFEKLNDVVLVGSSYGGIVITGVAERAPERIKHLIYLDAFLPEDGESGLDMVGPEIATAFEQMAQVYGDGWRVPHNPPDADRRVDFLLQTAREPLSVNNPTAAELQHTYVLFTDKADDDFLKPLFERMAGRAQAHGWPTYERPFTHWPLLDRSDEVAQLLLEVVGATP